jgi:hypothetical protein
MPEPKQVPNRIVHLGTTIQAVLAVVNEDGDVIHSQPLQMQIGSLKEDAFTEAFKQIVAARDKMKETPLTNEE